jgi:hypothetical protein
MVSIMNPTNAMPNLYMEYKFDDEVFLTAFDTLFQERT